ncbi:MAG: ABC transporter substrate-binding protein [Dehalococcoidia bacterium]|nr:ABC transporter substrate-binding protein [Dehalococcoidia bacterium]
MSSSKYWDRWWERRANRRRVLLSGGTAAVGAAGFALVGCGGDDDDNGNGNGNGGSTNGGTNTTPQGGTDPQTGDTPQPSGTYTFIGGPIGGNLDIHRTNTPLESAGLWHWIGNFLMRFNVENYEPEPDLAAAPPEITDDGLTVTFKLNPAAKWQDRAPVSGRNVTAEDVKWTFDRIRNPDTGSPRGGNYANVESIDAIDEETVQFKLKSPQADLLRAMSDQYDLIIPKEIAERGRDAIQGIEDCIGSGAYEVTSYTAGQSMEVKKRADGYWKPNTAWWDGARWTHQVDNQQKSNALKTGQVLATDLPADLVREYRDNKDFQILFAPNPTRECLLLNHEKEPYNDPRVRQAIWRAVNRELVYENVFAGGGIPSGPMSPAAANWVLPDDELGKLPGFRSRDEDLKEAKELLAAAGHADGFEDVMMTATAFLTNLLADQLVPALAEVGIRMTLENVGTDFNVMLKREVEGSYNAAATLFLSGPYPDAQLFIYHHSDFPATGSRNYGRYGNPQMDEMLVKQRTLLNQAEREALIDDIQVELINNPGPIWVGSRIQYYVLSSKLQNTNPHPFLAGYDEAESVWLKS